MLTEDDKLGFVTVFSGTPMGASTWSDADTVIAATTDDTVPTKTMSHYALLGASLSTGDLDGDGTDDLYAGAPYLNNASGDFYYEGGAYVFLGPFASSVGISDAWFAVTGNYDDEEVRVGGEAVAGEDLDGDGQDDLVFGHSYVEIDGDSLLCTGGGFPRAWLFFGPVSPGTHAASEADVLYIADDVDGFGAQVRFAGDTDGDGRPELIIGSWATWFGLFGVPTGAY